MSAFTVYIWHTLWKLRKCFIYACKYNHFLWRQFRFFVHSCLKMSYGAISTNYQHDFETLSYAIIKLVMFFQKITFYMHFTVEYVLYCRLPHNGPPPVDSGDGPHRRYCVMDYSRPSLANGFALSWIHPKKDFLTCLKRNIWDMDIQSVLNLPNDDYPFLNHPNKVLFKERKYEAWIFGQS